MTNLYEITQSYKQALSLVDEDWVITDEWLELLQESGLELKEKSMNICKVLQNFDSNIDAIKEEEKRLKKLRLSYEKNHERLKSWLSHNLQDAWLTTIDVWIFKLWLRKSESVIVEDEDSIPDEYKSMVMKFNIDKVAIKKDLKNWVKIDGVRLEKKENLQIK